MPGTQSFSERLHSLRQRSTDETAVLWIEQLPPQEALAELRGREGPVFRLQAAHFLLELEKPGEALDNLDGLADLPSGLGQIRDRLRSRALAAMERSPFAAATVASEASTQHGTAKAPFPAKHALSHWLDSVRQWREHLRV